MLFVLSLVDVVYHVGSKHLLADGKWESSHRMQGRRQRGCVGVLSAPPARLGAPEGTVAVLMGAPPLQGRLGQ